LLLKHGRLLLLLLLLCQVTTLLGKKEDKEQQQQPPSAEQLQQLREQVSAQGNAVKEAKTVRNTSSSSSSSRHRGLSECMHFEAFSCSSMYRSQALL
jgi:hypothetical protein